MLPGPARASCSCPARPGFDFTYLTSAPPFGRPHFFLHRPCTRFTHPPGLTKTGARDQPVGSGTVLRPARFLGPSTRKRRQLARHSQSCNGLEPLTGGAGLRLRFHPDGTLLGLPGDSTSPSRPCPTRLRSRRLPRSSRSLNGHLLEIGSKR
jgi:hypothetical protein